jgi:hypothetical protein
MPFFWVTHRTITYDPLAQAVLDKFTDPHDRFHDQLMGIEWLLARTPNVGVSAQKDKPNENVLFVSKGDELANTKDVWILYSYDLESVTVHGFKVV